MFADERLCLVDTAGEFSDGAGLAGEFPDDSAPDRAGEQIEGRKRVERGAGVAVLHVVSGM